MHDFRKRGKLRESKQYWKMLGPKKKKKKGNLKEIVSLGKKSAQTGHINDPVICYIPSPTQMRQVQEHR